MAAHNRSEWRRSVAQCIHLNESLIKVKVKVVSEKFYVSTEQWFTAVWFCHTCILSYIVQMFFALQSTYVALKISHRHHQDYTYCNAFHRLLLLLLLLLLKL